MSAILLQDELVHYEVLGRGRPVVFLHGWVGSWRYWIPSMQAASISFRAYALDLWGFGDTARNPGNYCAEGQAALLRLFLDELGIGRVALVGHGLGAIVALLYTASQPERVDRVMCAGLPQDFRTIHPRLSSSSPAELASWLLGRAAANEAAQVEAPKTDHQALPRFLESLAGLDLSALPTRIIHPGLLVFGLNDLAIVSRDNGWAAHSSPNIHHICFDASGHYPMLDEPAKFNRLLTDFLSLNPGEGTRQLQLKDEWKRRVR